MTGQYPKEHTSGAPTYAEYPDSIFRLLGAAYPANVSEVVTRLCAPSYCHPPRSSLGASTPPKVPKEGLSGLLTRARGQYEQMVALHDSQRLAEGDAVEQIGATATTTTPPLAAAAKDPAVTVTIPPEERGKAYGSLLPAAQPTRFAEWTAHITPDGPAALHLAHLLLPHFPWLHTASGRSYKIPDTGPDLSGIHQGVWQTTEGADLGRRRHLLQVGYVDRLLGTLVAHLKATHHWDDTVFVVTADHGVGFTPGGRMRELDDVNRDQILGVPLFVHAPGMEPGIDDRPAQNIDAVPTIAALLGVDIPWKVERARPVASGHTAAGGASGRRWPRLQPEPARRVDRRQPPSRHAAGARTYARDPVRVARPGPFGVALGSARRAHRQTARGLRDDWERRRPAVATRLPERRRVRARRRRGRAARVRERPARARPTGRRDRRLRERPDRGGRRDRRPG